MLRVSVGQCEPVLPKQARSGRLLQEGVLDIETGPLGQRRRGSHPQQELRSRGTPIAVFFTAGILIGGFPGCATMPG